MHIEYHGGSVAIQVSVFVDRPATGNPMFPARQKYDAFRFSVRSFPPFICGWLGRLTEC